MAKGDAVGGKARLRPSNECRPRSAGQIIGGRNCRWLLKTNHEWTQIPVVLHCRDDVMESGPPGSAGVPPAQDLAQPGSSPPPGSTGNGARTLLRPSPWRTRRQGGRVPHRRETERHRTGVHAGGTPALPGGASSHHSCSSRQHTPACRAAALPMGQSRSAWWPFVILRAPSWITLFSAVSEKRLPL